MAEGPEPTAVSCVKALTAFVENGKALLNLAEKESNEGWQHFVVVAQTSAHKNRHADTMLCCWQTIYGGTLSGTSRRPVSHYIQRANTWTVAH